MIRFLILLAICLLFVAVYAAQDRALLAEVARGEDGAQP